MFLVTHYKIKKLKRYFNSLDLHKSTFEDNSEEYFKLLHAYIPEIMNKIVVESSEIKVVRLLKKLFDSQENLMKIEIVGGIKLPLDLREIAHDFDNYDERIFDYLIQRIKNKSYKTQNKVAT